MSLILGTCGLPVPWPGSSSSRPIDCARCVCTSAPFAERLGFLIRHAEDQSETQNLGSFGLEEAKGHNVPEGRSWLPT
jgi:hypothetical protein